MTDKLRDAAQQDAQAVPPQQDLKILMNRLENQAHRAGELWERCQGKSWPEKESAEFAALRDVKMPQTRAALAAMLNAAPTPPAQQDAQAVPSDLVDKLRKFRGLPPHNNSSNVCQGDGYFYASIEAQYTPAQIAAANDMLNAALTPPTQDVTWNEYVETACALIKAADDAAADCDYMLDSDDCIKVLRGQWKAPLANDHPKPHQPAAEGAQPAEAFKLNPSDVSVEVWTSKPLNGFALGIPNGIKLTHTPTGLFVTCDTSRSMHANRAEAWTQLEQKVAAFRTPSRAGMSGAPTPPARATLTARELLNMMPESIPAEHDNALLEYARAVIEAYEKKNAQPNAETVAAMQEARAMHRAESDGEL